MSTYYIADSLVKGFYIAMWFISFGAISVGLLKFKPTKKIVEKILKINL